MKFSAMTTRTKNAIVQLLFILPFLPGLALLILAGACSDTAKTDKPEVKPPEYLTGHVAFQKMYVGSRGWARDAQGFRLMSVLTSDSKGHEGKSGMWNASFASAAQHSAKQYVWCGSNAPEAPERGVTWGSEDSYSPTNTSTHVFDIAFLKTDSDVALQTALKHGGEKLMEKDANQPVIYLLEWDGPSNSLIWRVIFGTARADNKLEVVVNASTGEFIRLQK